MLHRQFQGVNFSFMDYSLEFLILLESWKLEFSIGGIMTDTRKAKIQIFELGETSLRFIFKNIFF